MKHHPHTCAKVALALGLIDIAVTVAFVVMLGQLPSPTFLIRLVLWVGLPILFLTGSFDKKEGDDKEEGKTRRCLVCTKEFVPENPSHQYCSRECYQNR